MSHPRWQEPPAEPTGCVHLAFEAWARRYPERIAVRSGIDSLTYSELDSRANALARHLVRLGVGPDTIVVTCLRRSFRFVLAVLAIHKAGGAYLPVDPAHPAERIAFTLRDCATPVVVTEDSARPRLSHEMAAFVSLDSDVWMAEAGLPPPTPNLAPHHLAYVLYTSGSTGQPKGVLIEHRGVSNLFRSTARVLGVQPESRWLATSNFSFDISIQEFLWPLCHGQTVVVFRGDESGESISRLVLQHEITHLQGTPSRAQLLLEEPDAPRALARLRQLLLAGEALVPELVSRLQRHLRGDLFNLYGPTETTIYSVGTRIPDASTPVPIGLPMDNTDLVVVDEALRPLSRGSKGELLIGGDGLARGYLNRPELTDARFVTHPHDATRRAYRTGDLVRYRADGMLEYFGRLDHQVKIRGYRIELGEIEARLSELPSVDRVAVIAEPSAGGSLELVAYLTPRVSAESAPLTFERLRSTLKARLPEYFVPGRFVLLQDMPLTGSGKTDRKALSSIRGQVLQPVAGVEPRDDLERDLVGLWQRILGWDRVGIHDDFFELGGHSLLAMRIAAALHRERGVTIAWSALFRHRTVARLAEVLRSPMPGESSAPALTSPGPIRSGNTEGPLSAGQTQMCFLHQLSQDSATYNVAFAYRLSGEIDPLAVREAWASVVREHEILRTVFSQTRNEWIQRVIDLPDVPFEFTDSRRLPEAQRERDWSTLAEQVARHEFDLREAPLWRLALVRLADREFGLAASFQHALIDEWALRLLFRDLVASLGSGRTRSADHSRERPRYLDYALWQQSERLGPAAANDRAFWREELDGLPQSAELGVPSDFPRPDTPTNKGGFVSAPIAASVRTTLETIAREHGCSAFMLGLAAVHVLTIRLGGHPDSVVATPVSLRDRPELHDIVGLFLNLVPVRLRLDAPRVFSEFLRDVRDTVLAAFAHGSLPTPEILQACRLEGAPGNSPLLRHLFVLLNEPWPAPAFPGVRVERVPVHTGTAKADLAFFLTDDNAGGWRFELEYAEDLFRRESAERIAQEMVRLLADIARSPETVLATWLERDPVPIPEHEVRFNPPPVPFPREATLGTLFAATARLHPNAKALVGSGREWTYTELDSLTNHLATRFQSVGITRGMPVGVFLDRSPEFVVAILAILKAGGCYVPLPPELPQARLRLLAESLGLPFVICESKPPDALFPAGTRLVRYAELEDGDGMDLVAPHEPPRWLPRSAAETTFLETEQTVPAKLGQLAAPPRFPVRGPDNSTSNGCGNETHATDPAYVLFTSGSTGVPKGVTVPHRAVVRLVHGTDFLPWGPSLRFLLLAPIAFDASTLEIWGPLLHGGTCIVHPETIPTFDGLAGSLAEHRINVLWLTAGLFNQIVDHRPEILEGVDYLLTGGEALSVPHVRRALSVLPRTQIINGYGPTENTTFTTTFRIPRDGSVDSATSIPIGRPLANTRCHVLDSRSRPVPLGSPGELHIGGDGLALGYWNRTDLTASTFVPDPFAPSSETRLYRSGDRVRWRPDGNLEFLGRLDDQVKIRGFRIEPKEVEAVVARAPGVRQSHVFVRSSRLGLDLVACVETGDAGETDLQTVRAFVENQLPPAMVPGAWIQVNRFPLTPNGKTDQAALRDLAKHSAVASEAPSIPPRTDVESRLAGIWEQLLGTSRIGIHDDLISLGGHSLLAMRVVVEVNQEFGICLSIADLLRHSTIETQARLVETTRATVATIKGVGAGPVLFFVPGVAGVNYIPPIVAAKLASAGRFCDSLQYPGLVDSEAPLENVQDLARCMLRRLREIYPRGAICLAGYSLGGSVAHEMACILESEGTPPELVILYDAATPDSQRRRHWRSALSAFVQFARAQGWQPALRLLHRRFVGKLRSQREHLAAELGLDLPMGNQSGKEAHPLDSTDQRRKRVFDASFIAAENHRPRRYGGRLVLFRSSDPVGYGLFQECDPWNGWRPYVSHTIEKEEIPGNHWALFKEPGVTVLAEKTACWLRSVSLGDVAPRVVQGD